MTITSPKSFTDPICGMSTEDPDGFTPYEHDDTTFYFCSDHCLKSFKSNPDDYTGEKSKSSVSRKSQETLYTCPMHPEIIQDKPGSCPKCGMALEAVPVVLDEEEENPEYVYMLKRFILGTIRSVPLVIITMREMLPGAMILEP